jgi:hypothetical protein
MKKILIIATATLGILFLNSCQNKTQQLLTKKWDCIRVDNLDLGSDRFQNQQDSIDNLNVMAALESLSWTFKENHEYECTVAGRVMIKGSYGISEDGAMLICTPETKNSINRYTIRQLSENELVLGSPPLVLYFKPH